MLALRARSWCVAPLVGLLSVHLGNVPAAFPIVKVYRLEGRRFAVNVMTLWSQTVREVKSVTLLASFLIFIHIPLAITNAKCHMLLYSIMTRHEARQWASLTMLDLSE